MSILRARVYLSSLLQPIFRIIMVRSKTQEKRDNPSSHKYEMKKRTFCNYRTINCSSIESFQARFTKLICYKMPRLNFASFQLSLRMNGYWTINRFLSGIHLGPMYDVWLTMSNERASSLENSDRKKNLGSLLDIRNVHCTLDLEYYFGVGENFL